MPEIRIQEIREFSPFITVSTCGRQPSTGDVALRNLFLSRKRPAALLWILAREIKRILTLYHCFAASNPRLAMSPLATFFSAGNGGECCLVIRLQEPEDSHPVSMFWAAR